MDWSVILAMIGTGGLAGLVNWLVNLKVSRRKAELDKDDISRHMAERDNQTIVELYDRNRDILERLAALEEVLYKLVRCKHYDECPARSRLQEYKANLRYQRNRQPSIQQKGIRYARSDTGKDAGIPSDAGQPP